MMNLHLKIYNKVISDLVVTWGSEKKRNTAGKRIQLKEINLAWFRTYTLKTTHQGMLSREKCVCAMQ